MTSKKEELEKTSMNTGSQKDAPQGQAGEGSGPPVQLRLFVTGSTPRSQQAIHNIRTLCEEHLKGQYELEVIDIYQNPGQAREHQIMAVPTLLKELPPPLRKIVGDLSEKEKVLKGLDIRSF